MDEFFLNEEGVWFKPTPSKNEEEPKPIWVCSRLEIVAISRDYNNENFGKFLRFFDYDGVEHSWPMPLDLLATDGANYRQALLNMGLQIKEGKQGRELLARYLQATNPTKRIRCTTKLGWHKEMYVFPDKTIGKAVDEEIVFQSHEPFHSSYQEKGSLEEWKQNVSLFCVDNSRLAFSVSLAFAAPLLHLLGEEGGGFHLRGASSGGKTTALKVALSVYGGEKMLASWRATSNGLEAVAVLHNDGFLCLDELGKLDPKSAGDVSYLLASGEGKQRSRQSGYAKIKQTWRLLFLSSGEVALADLIRQSGQKVRGGHEVRIVDLPAFTGEYGVFEHLHSHSSGDAFSRMLCENAQKYHGTAGKAFISEICNDIPYYVTRLKCYAEEFKKANTPVNANGQVLRVLNRFSIVAAAGTLATKLKITGWTEEDAFWASQQCFKAWIENRGGISAQEEKEILSHVRLFFEQHGESRFSIIGGEEDKKTIYRVGYKKKTDTSWDFYVFPESFKNEICKGFDVEIAKSTLIQTGWIMTDSEGKSTRAEYLPCSSGTTRCYRFRGDLVFSEEI